MDKIKLKKSKIIARQILLYFIDFHNEIFGLFDRHGIYRVPLKAYEEFRIEDKVKFSQELYRLKRHGIIKEYFKDKEPYLELTLRGKETLKRYLTGDFIIEKPLKWDKKWRLVIFDIPNDKKKTRDILRHKLETLGFFNLQESVYVFPFDCQNEIEVLKNIYYIKPYVQYIVADRIETEIDLLKKFTDRGFLTEEII